MKKRKVDNCPVCEPINLLLDFLEEKKFIIIDSQLKDYHFHEMSFVLTGNSKIDIPKIDNIKRYSQNELICECHWSSVKIKYT